MRFLIGRQNMRVATLVLFIAASAVAEEWKLGTTQLQGSAGINIAEDRGTGVEPSFGGGVAVGMGPWLAMAGSYGYNRFVSIDQILCGVRVAGLGVMHEALVGLRTNISNPSPATPHFFTGAGMVHAVASGGAQGVKVSISETKVAYGVGGGVDIGIGKRVAVLSDIRLISPPDLNWCARFSTGLAIRFN